MRIKHNHHLDIGHEHVDNPEYRKDRNRAWGFLYMYMKEKGLKKRVGLDGKFIQVPSIIFRNDDIANDSNLEHLKEVYRLFRKHGVTEYYSVVPFGNAEVLKNIDVSSMNWEEIEHLTGFTPLNGEVVDFLKDSLGRGSKIILHGHTHTKLADMEESEIRKRLLEGKQYLESLLNCDIEYYASPFNYNTDTIRKVCSELNLKLLDGGSQLEKCVRESKREDAEFYWYHYWRFYEEGLSIDMLDRWLYENSGTY